MHNFLTVIIKLYPYNYFLVCEKFYYAVNRRVHLEKD